MAIRHSQGVHLPNCFPNRHSLPRAFVELAWGRQTIQREGGRSPALFPRKWYQRLRDALCPEISPTRLSRWEERSLGIGRDNPGGLWRMAGFSPVATFRPR